MSTQTTTLTDLPSSVPESSTILNSLQTNGYIIIPQLIPPSSPLFKALYTSSTSVTSQARTGSWPYVRTLPKQFPPWSAADAAENGIWGVQHLLHPSMPGRASFAAAYFADAILDVVRTILDVDYNAELVMELFNLLVRPGTAHDDGDGGADFALRWHRDDVSPEITESAEERALGLDPDGGKVYQHTQFNLSLVDGDNSLIVVPGSHRRARSEAEVRLMNDNPFTADMPGQLHVQLQAGDVVFYDNNILHRGVYLGSKERYTLHGSYSRRGAAGARARNVLQHGVGSWIDGCSFDGLDEDARRRAELMKDGLVEMGRQGGWTGEYSLRD